jgi:hypothetical protein
MTDDRDDGVVGRRSSGEAAAPGTTAEPGILPEAGSEGRA